MVNQPLKLALIVVLSAVIAAGVSFIIERLGDFSIPIVFPLLKGLLVGVLVTKFVRQVNLAPSRRNLVLVIVGAAVLTSAVSFAYEYYYDKPMLEQVFMLVQNQYPPTPVSLSLGMYVDYRAQQGTYLQRFKWPSEFHLTWDGWYALTLVEWVAVAAGALLVANRCMAEGAKKRPPRSRRKSRH